MTQQFAELIATLLFNLLAPWLNTVLPDAIRQTLIGYPIIDYRPALQSISGQISQLSIGTQLGIQQVEVLENQILAAMGQPQQRGSPVTLPTTPPAGYGGASSSSLADAVWQYLVPQRNNIQTLDALAFASALAELTLVQGSIPPKEGLYFQQEDIAGAAQFVNVSGNPAPSPNWANIGGYATCLAFLQGEWGGTWHTDGNNGTHYQYDNETTPAVLWRCLIDEPTFQWMKSRAGGSTVVVPPVWPGLSAVTLGASHALADGLIITAPMDGVIVDLTAVPAGRSRIAYGTVEAYVKLGALTFGSDDGHQEHYQSIDFQHEVYCPKTLKRAASVACRVFQGVTGTITPWTTA
jgi:hypothetical protein